MATSLREIISTLRLARPSPWAKPEVNFIQKEVEMYRAVKTNVSGHTAGSEYSKTRDERETLLDSRRKSFIGTRAFGDNRGIDLMSAIPRKRKRMLCRGVAETRTAKRWREPVRVSIHEVPQKHCVSRFCSSYSIIENLQRDWIEEGVPRGLFRRHEKLADIWNQF